MKNPPNFLCHEPGCHRMANTVFQLQPWCRQHMLVRVQELTPRNRAEQRSLAKQLGMLGKTKRSYNRKGPSSWRSLSYQQRMLNKLIAEMQAEDAEVTVEDADLPEWDNPGSPVDGHPEWQETESGLTVPSRG